MEDAESDLEEGEVVEERGEVEASTSSYGEIVTREPPLTNFIDLLLDSHDEDKNSNSSSDEAANCEDCGQKGKKRGKKSAIWVTLSQKTKILPVLKVIFIF